MEGQKIPSGCQSKSRRGATNYLRGETRSRWRRQWYPVSTFSKKLALAFLALGAIAVPALAGDLTDQQIIDKLKTPKLTRSLSGQATEAPALSANDVGVHQPDPQDPLAVGCRPRTGRVDRQDPPDGRS